MDVLGGGNQMRFLSIISSVYVSSSALMAYLYPELFIPLTVSYVSGVGAYELWNRFERRIGK